MFAFFINTQVFSGITHRTRALARMTEKRLRRKTISEQFQLHHLLLSWISRSQSNLFKHNLKNTSSGNHPVHYGRFLCFWLKFVLTKSTCGAEQPSLHWSLRQLEIQRRNQHQILLLIVESLVMKLWAMRSTILYWAEKLPLKGIKIVLMSRPLPRI